MFALSKREKIYKKMLICVLSRINKLNIFREIFKKYINKKKFYILNVE